MAKKDPVKVVSKLITEFFDLAGVEATAAVELIVGSDDQDVVEVNVKTDQDTGLLIGRRGETLGAIQSFLSLGARQHLGDWVRVVVNIGDWRDKEEERLKDLAAQVADRAKSTGESQTLYNLTAGQRRIVHMALSEDKEVETSSEGEGSERYLVVKPK